MDDDTSVNNVWAEEPIWTVKSHMGFFVYCWVKKMFGCKVETGLVELFKGFWNEDATEDVFCFTADNILKCLWLGLF